MTVRSSVRAALGELRLAPVRVRGYLTLAVTAALVLPWTWRGAAPEDAGVPEWVTAAVLVAISVLNVEISRSLTGGLSRAHQPHKALSGWAFAGALLLSSPWLLAVVPATYAHAWWRGLRVPLWKWVGSAAFLVLAGQGAAAVSALLPVGVGEWSAHDGSALLALLLSAAAFLAVETVLFTGSAYLGRAEDEVWLRRTLRSPSFYGTEAGVLLLAGLMAAVWAVGPWFTALLVPMYLLAQRAALHDALKERAEAAAELAEKNRELEAANQLKVDLLAMMGHELGNPLTSVVGYAQVALDALDGDDLTLARHASEAVDKNANRLRNVLQDILALVSNDLGALTARREPCLVRPHAAAAIDLQRSAGAPTPELDCPDDLHALVQPGHLDQILVNLLSNAEKYGGGASRVTARRTGETSVELVVADRGPGVPPEFRGRLFERFSRADGTADIVPGTGLGLFITRELARANGGDLSYRPLPDGGSAFVLTLEAAQDVEVRDLRVEATAGERRR